MPHPRNCQHVLAFAVGEDTGRCSTTVNSHTVRKRGDRRYAFGSTLWPFYISTYVSSNEFFVPYTACSVEPNDLSRSTIDCYEVKEIGTHHVMYSGETCTI